MVLARLHKLRHLSRSERRLLAEAWKIVALTRLLLWVLPLEKVRSQTARNVTFSQFQPLESTIWAVRAASARVPRATCLVQAVALQALLQKQGIAADLVIGVAINEEKSFQAHAWIEREGQILLGEAKNAEYQPLMKLESEIRAF